MDKISQLPDELLVKIITLVPTKVAVSTCILSRRWKFLWMFCTKLKYTDKDIDYYSPNPRLWEFVDKYLPLHRAPVKSFRLYYASSSCSGAGSKPEDIKRWIEIAVSRCVRELVIFHPLVDNGINILPNIFYTCKSLVYVKLCHVPLVDVPSTGCCLPSLKTLKLKGVSCGNEPSLQRLLSACPVLEELLVHFRGGDTMTEFTVIAPFLKSLSISIPISCSELVRYVIDTPSLEYLKIKNECKLWHDDAEIRNMPKLKEVCMCDVPDLDSYIETIRSVKRLTICPQQERYRDGVVFSQLEHLEICACSLEPLDILSQFLNDSPNLRVLDISVMKDHSEIHDYDSDGEIWNQPSRVPECLLSTLQIFRTKYFGRPHDRETAVYILKNARHLKTATILISEWEQDVSMITEWALSSRASSLCEIVVVEKESH